MEVGSELLREVKQSLSIVETATGKDEEIKLLILAGIQKMKDLGIEFKEDTIEDPLLKASIILFVKGTFGNVDIKEKERSMKVFRMIIAEKSLKSKGKQDENTNDN